jgi:hypothetical protein
MRLIERCYCGRSAIPKIKELEVGVYYACRCGRVYVGKKHPTDEYVFVDPVMDFVKQLRRRGHKVIDIGEHERKG